MAPDKAQQLGNDLACLAASISEIAEEIKAMYDFDHDADDGHDEPEPQAEAPKPKPPKPKAPRLKKCAVFWRIRRRAVTGRRFKP